MMIWMRALRGPVPRRPQWKRIFDAPRRIFWYLAASLRGRFLDESFPLEEGQSEVLFLSKPGNHIVTLNGKKWDPHLDPILDLATKAGLRCTKIEPGPLGFASLRERGEAPTPIDLRWLLRVESSRLALFARNDDLLGDYSGLLDQLERLWGSTLIDEEDIRSGAAAVEAFTKAYEVFLQRACPRVLFMADYFNQEEMGILRACRHLGITTVDVQHGVHSKDHGSCVRWSKTPREGYNLLPDYFWVWGKDARDNMSCWQPRHLQRNVPVVGGFPWIAKWKERPLFRPSPEEASLLKSTQAYTRRILFSAQPIKTPFPVILLDAMKHSPDDWLWLLRLHPCQERAFSKFRKVLAGAGRENFLLEGLEDLPLYTLLEISTHHATAWSTVGFEALEFGVPTCLIHEKGRLAFSSYVEGGTFAAPADAPAFLAWISQDSQGPCSGRGYIESGSDLASHALEHILKHPPPAGGDPPDQ
jgi:hypothetical protein